MSVSDPGPNSNPNIMPDGLTNDQINVLMAHINKVVLDAYRQGYGDGYLEGRQDGYEEGKDFKEEGTYGW